MAIECSWNTEAGSRGWVDIVTISQRSGATCAFVVQIITKRNGGCATHHDSTGIVTYVCYPPLNFSGNCLSTQVFVAQKENEQSPGATPVVSLGRALIGR